MTDSMAQSHPPLPPGQLALATIALAMSVLMNSLDVSVANVAIPTISGNLAVSSNEGTWIITSFAASRAIALPLSGWLARSVGEVRLFVIVTLLFTLFSALCGLSFSFPMLLIFRTLQGMAAGPTMPLSQSLLLANYPRERHGFANGIWAMTVVVGPVLGPILGGWVTDDFSWAWIFYINIPVGIIAAAVTWVLLRNRETPTERLTMDGIGLGLLIVGVTALQIMMDQGNEKGWFQSNWIIGLGIVALVTLSFFVVWELTDDNPVVDLRLFAQRNFTLSTIAITFGFMAYFGGVVVFPLWLQNYDGYTPTWAGLALAPLGLMAIVSSPVVGRLTDKVDARLLVSMGMLIFALLSFLKGSVNVHVPFDRLFLIRLPWGIGSALFLVPLFTLSLSGLPGNRVASASGLFNFMRLLAMSFGTSLSQTLWDHRSDMHEHHLAAGISQFSSATHHWLHRAHILGLNHMQGLAALNQEMASQAFMLGLNDMYWLSGWLFLAMTAMVWFAHPQKGG